MNVLAFDIVTVPDVDSGRRVYDLDGLEDADVAKVMFHKRSQQTGGSECLQDHLQRVVSISVLLRRGRDLKVWTLGEENSSERELLTRFFGLIEKYSPLLVSWDGSNTALPVLHYRALLHGVNASRYWEKGDHDADFGHDNYLAREHWRHIDVMDVLSSFHQKAQAPLNDVARMLGFPGNMGMSCRGVWGDFLSGDLQHIRNYPAISVLNIYLIYLRFEVMRGRYDEQRCADECQLLRETLIIENKIHFTEFLDAWEHVIR